MMESFKKKPNLSPESLQNQHIPYQQDFYSHLKYTNQEPLNQNENTQTSNPHISRKYNITSKQAQYSQNPLQKKSQNLQNTMTDTDESITHFQAPQPGLFTTNEIYSIPNHHPFSQTLKSSDPGTLSFQENLESFRKQLAATYNTYKIRRKEEQKSRSVSLKSQIKIPESHPKTSISPLDQKNKVQKEDPKLKDWNDIELT